MADNFELVKSYLLDMDIPIVSEDPAERLVVIDDEDNGVKDLVIDCEAPLLVLEQVIMEIPANPGDLFKRLLQMNRELVHGAFVMDEEARLILFRDTLQLEHLDRNELEASIQALGMALAEFSAELLSYVKR
jgi:hypothetical protein